MPLEACDVRGAANKRQILCFEVTHTEHRGVLGPLVTARGLLVGGGGGGGAMAPKGHGESCWLVPQTQRCG